MKKKRIKIKLSEFIKLLGYAWAMGHSLLMLITFLTAYASPAKATLVCIDKFGEANIELVLVPLTFAVIVAGFILFVKEYAKDNKTDDEPIDIIFVQEI